MEERAKRRSSVGTNESESKGRASLPSEQTQTTVPPKQDLPVVMDEDIEEPAKETTDAVTELTNSMSALRFVPPQIRFGRRGPKNMRSR